MLTEEEKLQYQKIDEEYAAKKAQRAAEAEQQIFSKADEDFIEKEQRLDEKYGDSPWQTFAESALSSVSFGLSDQVGKALGFQEALRDLFLWSLPEHELSLHNEQADVQKFHN